jgi:nitrite reductase/ring-hydroxylating ferredoxin subunit
MAEEFTRVGALAEVPEGELRAFEMTSGRACVGHSAAGVFAIGDECTHQGCSLSEDGELMPDGVIVLAQAMAPILGWLAGGPFTR